MASKYILRGKATINGAMYKNFEEIVSLEQQYGSQLKIDAIKRIHPDWTDITVESWEAL